MTGRRLENPSREALRKRKQRAGIVVVQVGRERFEVDRATAAGLRSMLERERDKRRDKPGPAPA